MHRMIAWLLHLHGWVFLLCGLRVHHLILHIIRLVGFVVLKLGAFRLRLHGHHGLWSIVGVHLRRWHAIVRMVDGSSCRNGPHWPRVVVRRGMDVGQGRVLRRIHVRHHVIYWRHVHVGIVELLGHRRRRLLLEVPLLWRRSGWFLLG
jgi:hypothetical protein